MDCTGLGTPDLPNRQPFAVYPNPTDGRVTLAWNASGALPTIEVYDLRGQLVHTLNATSQQTSYDLNLPPGLYVLNCPEWNAAVKLQITP